MKVSEFSFPKRERPLQELRGLYALGASSRGLSVGLFSRWMANFGVLPWFLFLAFLLAPSFLFLLDLFFLVFLLKETIAQLLRWKYLPPPFIKAPCNTVKSPLLLIVIFQGLTSIALASGPHDHVISIGEHSGNSDSKITTFLSH